MENNDILLTEDPLAYWEQVKHVFLIAYKVIVRYLSVVATPVSSKRLFSRAGYIQNDLRNRIHPELLSVLTFLSLATEEECRITNHVTQK